MNYTEIFDNIKKSQFDNLYLFYGEEEYIKEQAVKQMINALVDSRFEALNFQDLDGSSVSVEDIINACDTLPFMAEKRLVLIKDSPLFDAAKNDTDQQKLSDYINNLPSTTCVVFYNHGEVDKRKALYLAIKRTGKIICFDHLKEYEAEKWVRSTLKKHGKAMDQNHIRFLIFQTGTNLGDVYNELMKLISYAGDSTVITKDAIEKIVTPVPENTVFQLIDEIGKRNRQDALILFNQLIYQGQSVFGILSMIARQFRLIMQCSAYKQQGYSPKVISSKLKTAGFIVDKCLRQSINFSIEELEQALKNCSSLDYDIKRGRIEEKLGAQMLIIKLCETKKAS